MVTDSETVAYYSEFAVLTAYYHLMMTVSLIGQ